MEDERRSRTLEPERRRLPYGASAVAIDPVLALDRVHRRQPDRVPLDRRRSVLERRVDASRTRRHCPASGCRPDEREPCLRGDERRSLSLNRSGRHLDPALQRVRHRHARGAGRRRIRRSRLHSAPLAPDARQPQTSSRRCPTSSKRSAKTPGIQTGSTPERCTASTSRSTAAGGPSSPPTASTRTSSTRPHVGRLGPPHGRCGARDGQDRPDSARCDHSSSR